MASTDRVAEKEGQLHLEAEAYTTARPSTFAAYATPHHWAFGNEIPGFTGTGYLEVVPDERGEDGQGPNSPRGPEGAELRYPIRITTPGTWYVWVRGYAKGGESNGIHVGVNGKLAGVEPGASNISGFRPVRAWQWEQTRKHRYPGVAMLELTAGEHVLHVWSRDDGFRFDGLRLTLSPEPPTDE